MSAEETAVRVHPEGESKTTGSPVSETSSVDTFAGKVHVKWSAEAAVSSLGLMPYFIEFLKTSGLFDKWVEECHCATPVPTRRRSETCWERFFSRYWPAIGGMRT